MRFYSYKDTEGVIHLEVTPFSYGYFYEAKDLTKHPFLDRYKDELIEKMKHDRSGTRLLTQHMRAYSTDGISRHGSAFPVLFALFVDDWIGLTVRGNNRTSLTSYKRIEIMQEYNVSAQDIRKHFKWILLRYVKGGIVTLDDMDFAVEAVGVHIALIRAGLVDSDKTDLNRFKTLSDLAKYRKEIWEQPSADKGMPERVQKLIRSGELEIYYEDSRMVVYNILTSKACELTGSADWCTTRGAFNSYKKDGDLYTVHIKGKPDERYHLSFARFEFTDENNNPLHSLAVKQLSLDSVFKGSIFDKSATKHRQEEIIRAGSDENIWLEDVLDIMDANQKELYVAIETYPEMLSNLEMDAQIDFLVDHNELVDYATHGAQKKFIGVEGYWEAIRYIKKPDLGLQTAAIDHSPEALGLIDDPDWRAQEYHDSVWPIEDEDREDDF